jgi:outer membrane protein
VQPVLRGGGWLAGTGGVRDASYEVQIASANLEAVRLAVLSQVKTSYYEVIRQSKLVQVNKEAIKRDEQLLLHSKSKLEAGLATRRDQLSAEIILEQDRGKLADAETEREHALDQLSRAMGVPMGTAIELAQHDVDLDPIDIREEEWIASALQRNPTILAARLSEQRSELTMRLAGNARLPQLDFGIFYRGFVESDINEEQIEENRLKRLLGDAPDPLEPTSFRGWSYQVTINYPIGNKTFGNAYKRTQYVHKATGRIREDVEERTIAELRAAVRNLKNSTVRLGILEKEMEGARDKLEFATINFQLGRASNLDVTDAQKDLLDAETDYVNKVIDYRIGMAQIEALIGGLQ